MGRPTSATANPAHVLLGTLALLGLSAVPFAFKTVREREANVVSFVGPGGTTRGSLIAQRRAPLRRAKRLRIARTTIH